MNTIKVFPKNIEEKNAIKAFLDTQNIKFEISEEKNLEMKFDSDFLNSMEQSFKEVMSDKIPMREFDLKN